MRGVPQVILSDCVIPLMTKGAEFKAEPISLHADGHWDFLAKFPSLSRSYSYSPSGLMAGAQKEENEDCRKINDGGIVTLLMVSSLSWLPFYIGGTAGRILGGMIHHVTAVFLQRV